MADAGHYIGCIFSLFAAVGIMVTVIHHEWKQSSNVNSPGSLQFLHITEGLWLRCVYPSPSLIQCDNFGVSFLGLPGELHARRAMMVIAEIFAFTGAAIGAFSLPCTIVRQKRLFGRIAGGCMGLAGIFCLVPVSMYAIEVVNEYYEQYQSHDIIYTFGPALYVGWVSSGLALVSGVLMTLCSKNPDENFQPFMEKLVYV